MRLTRADFDTDLGWMEYNALVRIWKSLDSLAPSEKTTWRGWFKKRFGREATEAADEYVSMRQRKASA